MDRTGNQFSQEWPETIDGFELFPKADMKDFGEFRICDLSSSFCTCSVRLPLLDHIYKYQMCPIHIPNKLLTTPGKTLIDNNNLEVVKFLNNPKNSIALDLLAAVERSIYIFPGACDHCMVIHKFFSVNEPGLSGEGIICNTKFELHHHEYGIRSIIFPTNVGDINEINSFMDQIISNCRFVLQNLISELHSQPWGKAFKRKRANSI